MRWERTDNDGIDVWRRMNQTYEEGWIRVNKSEDVNRYGK